MESKMANPNDDDFARDSFTMRRMKPWQLWGITIAAAALGVAMLIYNAG
jgi:hypothetical protein